MDKHNEYNNQLNEVIEAIRSKQLSDAEAKLIELIKSAFTLHPEKPKGDTAEYTLFDFLFFYANKNIAQPIEVSGEVDKDFPLNSKILQCCREPNQFNSVLFQGWCHLHPEDSADHTFVEIRNAIEDYKKGVDIKLQPHLFEYSQKPDGTGIVNVKIGPECVTTHILTY